jgi:hypothetical protein
VVWLTRGDVFDMTGEKIRETGENGVMKRFMIGNLHQIMTSVMLWAGYAISRLL